MRFANRSTSPDRTGALKTASDPDISLIRVIRSRYVIRQPSPSLAISYRWTPVQCDADPFFVVSVASVTNSKTVGRDASVTTDVSRNLPMGSAPVVVNSVPTTTGPSEASIDVRRVFFPWRSPAQTRRLGRSVSTS